MTASRSDGPGHRPRGWTELVSRGLGFALKLPIYAYRYSLKAFVGFHCRHLPTCSEYALEAIDRNGPWRGGWLTVSRLWRCRPGGTSGYDPVPDIAAERHTLAPWQYGRWRRVCCPDCAGAAGDQFAGNVASRAAASSEPSSRARSYQRRAS